MLARISGRRRLFRRLFILLSFLFASHVRGAAACEWEYCVVDLDFAGDVHAGCGQWSDCVNVARATGKWVAWNDGHLSHVEPGAPALSDKGLLVEPEAQNHLRFSRDLSRDAWRKTGASVSLAATGADGAENAASVVTAEAPAATVSQALRLPEGPHALSLFLRRRAGAGRVEISYDGGGSWLRCQAGERYSRCATAIDRLADPVVVLRLEAQGDAVDVDFVQLEDQRWPSSPIATQQEAPVRRAADLVTLRGPALAALGSPAFSLLLEGSGLPPREGAAKPVELIGGSAVSVVATPVVAEMIEAKVSATGERALARLGWNGSPLLAQGSLSKPFRVALSSGPGTGAALCADAGEVTNFAAVGSGGTGWSLGGAGAYGGYFRRLTLWSRPLDNARLRAASRIEIAPARVWDIDKLWTGYAVRDTLNVNGADYEVQGGIRRDAFTGTSPAQSIAASYFKFNQFPGNTWAIDDPNPYVGSERVELSGNLKGSLARFPGPVSGDIWISDAVYVEKGDPITTDWLTIGQIHDRVGLGPVFSLSVRAGEYVSVDMIGKDVSKTLARMPFSRGRWYRRVFNLKFDPNGAGYIRVWIDGKQLVDYHGPTGNPDTEYYYWKFGLYRSHAPEYTAARYANVRVGHEELAAKIEAPDPLPMGYCTDDGSC